MTVFTAAAVLALAANPACSVPGMAPEFWPAVVRQESGYDAWALHDDTADIPFHPSTAADAEDLARNLMAQHHSVGVGLSQLTASSEQEFSAKFGISIRDALDPCQNMKVGARFYVDRALSIYNTGSPVKGLRYAAAVQSLHIDPATTKPMPSCPVPDDDGWHSPSVPPRCLEEADDTQH